MSTSAWRILRFGSFEADVRAGELHKQGHKVSLQDQPFQILIMLLEQPGELVTRQEIHQKLWPADTFVDFDHGLNNAINRLREALGDSAGTPRFIETVPRKGYRFIGQVSIDSPTEPVAEPAVPPAVVVAPAQSFVAEEVQTAESASDGPSTWRSRLRLWQLAAVGGALLAVGGGLAWWLRPVSPRQVEAVRITANPADTPVTGAVISPDGKYVAYSDPTGVYIRHIDSGETRPLSLPKGFDVGSHTRVKLVVLNQPTGSGRKEPNDDHYRSEIFTPSFSKLHAVDTDRREVAENNGCSIGREAETFYRRSSAARAVEVRIGIEASGHARWLERLLAELQLELWIGDAAEIQKTRRVRKQKTDRQDAQLILKLLLEDRFPRIWVASWENRDLRQLLWHRHRMVQARTRIINQLQAVALNEGVRCKKSLWRERGRQQPESFEKRYSRQRRLAEPGQFPHLASI